MGLKDYQTKIIRQFETQERLLAELYAVFARQFSADQDFWNRLVKEEMIHAGLIEKLHAAVEKGAMIFDEGKVKTYTLTAMIERMESLLKRAHQGDFDQRGALAQAMDLESALIEKGVFTHFEPMTEKARAILKRLNAETLDHLAQVRRKRAETASPSTLQDPAAPSIGLKLQWSSALSVGIADLDQQHRNLFELINRVKSLHTGGPEPGEISDLIRDMLRYSDEHFKAEDEIMIDSDFPLFGSHRREHQKYMEKIRTFVGGLQSLRPGLVEEMIDFLTLWWIDHINESDLRYARWLRRQGDA